MKHSTIRKFFAAAALACLCLPVLQSCGGDDPAEDISSKPTTPAEPSKPADPSEPSTPTANTVHITGVKINPATLNLVEGESQTITVTITPENATNKTVKWQSSDEQVATVNSLNVVTAHNMGSAILTLTTVDGNHKVMCIVNVSSNGGTEVQLPDNYSETIIDNSKK